MPRTGRGTTWVRARGNEKILVRASSSGVKRVKNPGPAWTAVFVTGYIQDKHPHSTPSNPLVYDREVFNWERSWRVARLFGLTNTRPIGVLVAKAEKACSKAEAKRVKGLERAG